MRICGRPRSRRLLAEQPAHALPLIFKHVVPPLAGLLGLAAIIGAVTSSFSSSILSAGSMFSWNVCWRLINPGLSFGGMKLLMRVSIVAIGAGAVWMALEVQSVQALWFFTSDLVFVLLFPQLVSALFDSKANLAGSIAAFSVSLVLRVGGGEPLFSIPAVIPYPEWVPFKTLAAGVGLMLLPVVSRLTAVESAAAFEERVYPPEAPEATGPSRQSPASGNRRPAVVSGFSRMDKRHMIRP